MKTLKLNVYLWRDGKPAGTDCWDYGCVYVPAANRKLPGRGTLFNKSGDLPEAMRTELAAAGLNTVSLKRSS